MPSDRTFSVWASYTGALTLGTGVREVRSMLSPGTSPISYDKGGSLCAVWGDPGDK